MNHTNQYYFSLEKLEALKNQFQTSPVSGKNLKGFVFTPGFSETGAPAVFAFPVFSVATNPRAGADGDILIQNTAPALSGCPYPPPCPVAVPVANDESCYL